MLLELLEGLRVVPPLDAGFEEEEEGGGETAEELGVVVTEPLGQTGGPGTSQLVTVLAASE